MKPSERHHARECALQALYQWQISKTSIQTIEAEFLKEHISEPIDLAYFKELIHDIPKFIDEIDQTMTPYLTRSLSECDPVELAVLRIGVYELLKRPDIHVRIIINEALELTKKFGSVEGFKFVNGVLDKIARQLRQHEVSSGEKGRE